MSYLQSDPGCNGASLSVLTQPVCLGFSGFSVNFSKEDGKAHELDETLLFRTPSVTGLEIKNNRTCVL